MRKCGEIVYGEELLQADYPLGNVVYGSMDPFTHGHEFMTLSAIDEFEHGDRTQVLLAIVKSFYKTIQTGNPPIFNLEERAELIRKGYPHLDGTPIILCKPTGLSDEEIGPRTEQMNAVLASYIENQESGDTDNKLSKTEGRINIDEIVEHMLEVYAEDTCRELSSLWMNTELINVLKTWIVVRWMKFRSMRIIKGRRGKADHEHTVDLFDAYLLDECVQNNFVEIKAQKKMKGVSSRQVKTLVRNGQVIEAKRLAARQVIEVLSERIKCISEEDGFVVQNDNFGPFSISCTRGEKLFSSRKVGGIYDGNASEGFSLIRTYVSH